MQHIIQYQVWPDVTSYGQIRMKQSPKVYKKNAEFTENSRKKIIQFWLLRSEVFFKKGCSCLNCTLLVGKSGGSGWGEVTVGTNSPLLRFSYQILQLPFFSSFLFSFFGGRRMDVFFISIFHVARWKVPANFPEQERRTFSAKKERKILITYEIEIADIF